jgi:NDP-sugar pyrophosphorylase family protein
MSAAMFPVAILAGGVATRLRPLTEAIPKALIDVNGEPFVAHQLRLLRARGIEQVVLCIGYRGEQIAKVVGDGSAFGLQVAYAFDGPTLLGTAGAIRHALPILDESFFVLYGDSYLECDYEAVQTAFERASKLTLMTVYRNEGHWDTSNVEFADGHIRAYSKQQRTRRMKHIDYGLGVFNRAAFAGVPEHSPYDLESLYHDMLQQDQLAAFEVSERFYEIGSPAGLDELRRHLTKSVQGSSQS